MRMLTRCLLVCTFLWALAAHARADEIVFVHAVIHPATGPSIPNGQLVVRDGRIVSAGPAGSAPTAGATVIDARGLHLYPSLIDADSSLGLMEIDAVRATRDESEMGPLNADARVDLAFNPDSQLLPVAMSAGILVAGISPRGDRVCGRTAVMRLHGWTREDMTVRAPAALYVKWPRMTLARAPWDRAVDKQRKTRERALRALDDAFEDARSWMRATEAGTARERDVQWEALAPVLRGEIPVMVEADGLDEIRAARHWAARQKVKMVLVGGRDAWRDAKALAAARIPVIYTAILTVPSRDHEAYDVYYRAPAVLAQAGVTVALSSTEDAANARYLSDLGGRARAYGLGALESLQSVTLHAAEILGVADRLGSLTAGKEATFFLADGDILDTRTHVLRAWVQGREIDLGDRQKALYEKYRNRPR